VRIRPIRVDTLSPPRQVPNVPVRYVAPGVAARAVRRNRRKLVRRPPSGGAEFDIAAEIHSWTSAQNSDAFHSKVYLHDANVKGTFASSLSQSCRGLCWFASIARRA